MRANLEFGVLSEDQAQAIGRACDDIIDGNLHEHFVVDLIQGLGHAAQSPARL